MSIDITVRDTAARLPDGSVVAQVEAATSRLEFGDADQQVGQAAHIGGGRYIHLVRLPDMNHDIVVRSRTTVWKDSYTLSIDDGGKLTPHVTIDEWRELPDALRELYRQDHDVKIEEQSFPLPDKVLDIDMDGFADVPRNWRPGIVGTVLGPGFEHAFPGRLSGWRERVVEIATEYAKDVWTHQSNHHIEARVISYYDPPRHVPAAGRGRKARPASQEFRSTSVQIDTPDSISGTSLADARRRWADLEAEVRAQLERYTKAKVCGHCNGDGWLVGS